MNRISNGMNTFFKRFAVSAGVAVVGLLGVALPAHAGVPGIATIKVTGPNTITLLYTEAVSANAGDYSNFTGSIASRSVAYISGNGTNTITLNLNGEALPPNATGYMTLGSNTVSVSDRSPFPGGIFSVSDAQAPALISASIASLDGISPIGKLLKTLTINFTLNEAVSSVSVSVLGRTVPVSGNAAGPYTLSYTMAGSDIEGTVPVSLSFTDSSGNVGRASFTASSGATSGVATTSTNTVTSNANTSGVLKIGDSITFTLTPSVMQPNARVNGSYNGVPLSWYTTNGGVTYVATYVVSAGNNDQTYPLQISGVTLTDQFGQTGAAMTGIDVAKTIVASSPNIYEVSPVPTISTTATPNYSFQSNKAGTVRYGGDCYSNTSYVSVGANTVMFNQLSAGLHSNCTISVMDAAGNMSNQLIIAPFTIQTGAVATTPTPPVSTPVVTTPTASDLAAKLAALQSQLAAAQSSKYKFTRAMSLGSSGDEVLELQKRLKSEGYLTATPNGNFGPATQAAVKAYQKAHGIAQLGNVGPGTRAALNQ